MSGREKIISGVSHENCTIRGDQLVQIVSQYPELDLQRLLDLLIVYVKQYEQMLSSRVFTEEEFAQCRRRLAELHVEIKLKAAESGYPIEKVLPSFPEEFPGSKNLDN